MPFPVTCPACGKSFSISDEIYEQKIKGRLVSVKCKQCQGAIRVDGTKANPSGRTQPTEAPPPPAPVEAAPPPAAVEAAPPPAAVEAAPPPAAVEPALVQASPPSPPSPEDPAIPATREDPSLAAAPREKSGEAPVPAAAAKAAPVAREPFVRSGLGARGRTGALGSVGGGTSSEPRTNASFGTRGPVAAAAPLAPPPTTAVAAAAPAPAPAPAATPLAAPAAPRAAGSDLLFAVDSPGGDRELTVEQIGREIASGSVAADTLVWRDGMNEWLEVKKVPELATFLKRPEAPKPSPLRTAPSTGQAPAGRFRPRQPTLPMGALPDRAGARGEGPDPKAEPKGRAPAPAPEPKRDQKTTGPLGSRIPFLEPAGGDEEPTVLRSPDAVAALLSAASEDRDEHTPVPPRLAAQLASGRTSSPELGTATPPLPPVAPKPGARTELGLGVRNPLDRLTPAPGVPLGMPGSLPSSERRPSSVGTGPKVSPIDTFRESPEAKRAWFPEPVPGQGMPPLPEEPKLGASNQASPPAPFAHAPAASPPPPAPPPPIPLQATPPARSPSPLQLTTPPFGSAGVAESSDVPAVALGSSGFVPGPSMQTPPTHAGVALGGDVNFHPKRGKAIWIVLALMVLAAVAAVIFFVVLGGASKPLPPAPPAPVAELPQAPAATETAEAKAPSAPAPTSSEAAAEASAEAPLPAGNRDPLAEPTASAPVSGGFADLFAEGAKKASSGRFDPKLAKSAVEALLVDASRCRERDGPTGITRVTITFAPTGRVSGAVVQDAPLTGTATAACIASVFKRATVQPFTGSSGSITERISIQ